MKQTLRRTVALAVAGVVMGLSAQAQSYCTPVNNGGCSQQIISHFEIQGTTLVNPSYCTEGSKYVVYPPGPSTTAILTPGLTYTLKVGSSGNGNPAQMGMWIDYNQNGTFENSEFTFLAASVASPGGTTPGPLTSVTFTVPTSATTGPTRLRVRSNWADLAFMPPISAGDACVVMDYGETEDYTVTFGTLTPCSGTPSAGISSTVTSICASTPFNLSATPTGLSGVTYLFQKSTDGGATWTNLAPASGSAFYTVASQTVTTQYRVQVACTTSGGGTGTSTAITVTQNPITSCYCTPATGGGTTYYMSNFTTSGAATNINKSSGSSTTGYQDFHASDTLKVHQGTAVGYSMTVTGGGSYGRAIWIDYNENGVFESTEQVASSTSYLFTPLTGSFTIPITATPGNRRMRVLASYSPANPSDPCLNSGSGEYEDYMVSIIALSPCTGTPSAGITTTVTTICAGVPFTLTATPVGMSGLTYQFQVSTDGGATWSNLGTASAVPNYTVPSQTVASKYRVLVTCSGGSTGTSTAITVNQSPGTSCFCTPTYTYGCSSGDNLDGFVMNGEAGTAINHTGTGCSTGGYGDFTSMSVSLYQGFSYPGTVTTTYGGNWEDYRIWIDFNDNGLFESSESMAYGTGIGSTTPGTFTMAIAPTATTGSHRMRVRLVYNTGDGSSIDPCINYSFGETHDYTVNIISPAPCTGTPLAGTTVSSAPGDSVCPMSPVSLTVTGGPLESGITYQWQSSTDGGTTWVNITGATGASYSAPSVAVATCFRRKATCTSSGSSVYSATKCITMKSFISCYCMTSLGGSCGTQSINRVSITGTSLHNTSTCTTIAGVGVYSAYPNADSFTTTLIKGIPFEFKVSTGNNGNPAQVAVWIDYDHSGTFDASEYTLVAASSPSNTSANPIALFSTYMMNIPTSALNGLTKMRVRSDWASSSPVTATMACDNLPYGETEDYFVTIAPGTPCSGTPAATISTTVTNICAGVPFTLTAGPTGTTGLTYTFESSTDGGATWTTLGTPGSAYTYTVPSQTVTTQYRVKVSCSGGTPGTSTSITVTQNPALSCYCVPVTTSGVTYYISNFTTTGGSVNISKTSSSSVTGYQDFHTTDSVKAVPGTTINYSMTVAGGSNYGRAIWVDWNENGAFETGEQIVSSSSYEYSPLTGTFTIPMTATPGVKRMRILASYTPSNPSNPCSNSGNGEYEDYNLIVAVPPPCSGTPVAGTISMPLPKTYCLSAPAKTLTLSGYTAGVSGIAIQWQSSTDGTTFTDLPGATSPSYTTATSSATTYYRAKVTCGGSGLFTFSTADTVKVTNPTPVAAPVSTTICSGTSTNVPLSSGTPGVTFSWDAPVVTGGTVTGGAAGTGSNISQTLVNTGTTPATVTYTVTGSIGSSAMLVYTFEGVAGSAPTAAQCAAWDAFRASLNPTYTYNYVNLKGTFDMTGRTVTDPVVATNIANALHDGVSGGWTSGGNTWVVGTTCGTTTGGCGGGTVELSANGDSCSCANPGYAIRPNLLNENWGGVNSATCPSPTQTVYVTIGYDGTCTATTTVSITVDPSPAITAEPVATSACEGQPFTLSVSSPSGTSYQWYKDGSAISGATMSSYNVPSASLPNAGNYYVVINGCTSSDTVAVAVGAPMTVDIGADTMICAGDNIMLNAGNPGASYMWSTGDNTQTVVVNSAGTYSVTVTNSACTAEDSITVSELPAPEAGTITSSGTTPAFTFNSSGTTGAGSLTWLFGDGGNAAGPTASHTYTTNGTYNVLFIVTNECGQSDTATTSVTVTGLSVDPVNLKAGSVQVYPNPTSGLTMVEAKGSDITSIEVVDNLGRVVMRQQPNAARTTLDAKGLADGVYTLRITTTKGNTTTKLVVTDK